MSVGRNDPCPCGSGRKYKKCCQEQEEQKQLAAIEAERVAAAEREARLEASREAARQAWLSGNAFAGSNESEPKPQPEPTPELVAAADEFEAEFDAAEGRSDMIAVISAFCRSHAPLDPYVLDRLLDPIRDLIGLDVPAPDRPAAIEFGAVLCREHPELFWRLGRESFLNLLAWSQFEGRTDLFDVFLELIMGDPNRKPDLTFLVIDFLHLTGAREPLWRLISRITGTVRNKGRLIDQDRIIMPLSTVVLTEALEASSPLDASEAIIRHWHEKTGLPFSADEVAPARQCVIDTLGPVTAFDPTVGATPSQAYQVIGCQGWPFMRFLHDTTGVPWFVADRLRQFAVTFFLRRLGRKAVPADLYRPSEKSLKAYLEEFAGDTYGPWPAVWFGTLTALCLHARFLHEAGVLSADWCEKWRQTCAKVFADSYPDQRSSEPWVEVFARFPLYGEAD